MTYRVTFHEQANGDELPMESPSLALEENLPNDIVVRKAIVQRTVPDAPGVEDDGQQTWLYDIADGREDEFLAAAAAADAKVEDAFPPVGEVNRSTS